MSELKNCPFCPDGVGILKDRYVQGIANRKTYWVECNKCQARIQNRRSAKRAVEAWNADYRRVPLENEPLVRCGECKFFEPYEGEKHKGDCLELIGLESCMYEEDFCSYGEHKPERSEG